MTTESWSFDKVHSSVNFWVRHLMVSKVHGRFTQWEGTLVFDEQEPKNSRVEVRIDAASIDTKEPQRDGHLRSPDFLDAEKHPTLTFVSQKVERGSGAHFKVEGDLTIRGVTRPITLDVEYSGRVKHPQMGERAGFSARATVNRKDFGLNWNQLLEAGGVLVGDNVEVHLEIEAVKQSDARAAA